MSRALNIRHHPSDEKRKTFFAIGVLTSVDLCQNTYIIFRIVLHFCWFVK